MNIRMLPLGAALACAVGIVVASPARAQSADVGALYRCPGNDYSNTISEEEAQKLRCRKVDKASVTVIQTGRRAASSATAAVPVGSTTPITSADSAALRARASKVRRGLEGRIRTEEVRLRELEDEFNGGEPTRRDDEFDFQKYLDRVAGMRSAIARKQIDIAELRREIQKLPPAQ